MPDALHLLSLQHVCTKSLPCPLLSRVEGYTRIHKHILRVLADNGVNCCASVWPLQTLHSVECNVEALTIIISPCNIKQHQTVTGAERVSFNASFAIN